MTKLIKDNKIISFGDSIETESYIIFNPTKQDYIDNGWVEYVPTLEGIRNNKIDEIKRYDSSSEVNEFYINGIPMWLEPAERQGILRFLDGAQISNNMTEDDIIEYSYDSMTIKAKIRELRQLIYSLDFYAGMALNMSNVHIENVKKLTTKEEIINYKYEGVGYPDKINVTI